MDNITHKPLSRNSKIPHRIKILLAQHRDLCELRRAISADIAAIHRALREAGREP